MYQRHKWTRRQKREAIKVFIHTGKGIDAGGRAEKQGLWRASPDGLAQIPEEIEVSTEGSTGEGVKLWIYAVWGTRETSEPRDAMQTVGLKFEATTEVQMEVYHPFAAH